MIYSCNGIESKETVEEIRLLESNNSIIKDEPADSTIANIKSVDNESVDNELLKYRKLAFTAIKTGDTILYNEVSNWYLRSRTPENLLFFANLMAKKYNYHRAYHNIYFINNGFYRVFDSNDSAVINYVYYNLAKAHELGHVIRYETILGKYVTNENIGLSKDYLIEYLLIFYIYCRASIINSNIS